ncbi:MAG TPA: Asp-tRNA(Asn)/Glu-tRNA(Gln) amidotransferase subunit GatC [Usitatibacteraceae bacterium]|nr:Asp-tRNA(Asn)/Glu-tRNA(Gln) amidotransferase subunit GatC [Usitatibacteraceae bacterium]
MSFQPKDIERLARLARIALEAEETPALAREMSGIFDLIDQLQSVDTGSVQPLASPLDLIEAQVQRLREDRVDGAIDRDANLANAPQAEHGLFLVPKVIE